MNASKVVLTDVDGVLLEWEKHFTNWMTDINTHKSIEGKRYKYEVVPGTEFDYSIPHRFGITREVSDREILYFNSSEYMRQQPVRDGADVWVKRMNKEGWHFIPITSQTDCEKGKEFRKERLKELFGDIFTEYYALGLGAKKDNVLEKFDGTGYFWLEDKPSNAMTGLKYGLQPILVDHQYNREFNHSSVRRAMDWENIYNIVTGSL